MFTKLFYWLRGGGGGKRTAVVQRPPRLRLSLGVFEDRTLLSTLLNPAAFDGPLQYPVTGSEAAAAALGKAVPGDEPVMARTAAWAFVGPLQYPDGQPAPRQAAAQPLAPPSPVRAAAPSRPGAPSAPLLLDPPPSGGVGDEWTGADAARSNNWTDDLNWSLGHYPDHNSNGTEESAVFNGNFNIYCNVNGGIFPIAGLTLTNGFTAVIYVYSGVNLECTNGFEMLGGGTVANIHFLDSTSALQADSGTSLLNNSFDFNGAGQGTILTGATLNVQNNAASQSGANFNIWGALNVSNTATVAFADAASIWIDGSGSMTLGNAAAKPLASSGTGGIYVTPRASFTYNGGTGTTEVDMPLYDHGAAKINGGTLYFNGFNTDTNGYGYKMDSGTTTLEQGATLKVLNGYYQTGGTLSVADTTPATLDGEAIINAGKLTLGTSDAFGTLKVANGGLTFEAEFDAKINGSASGPGNCDLVTSTYGGIAVGGASTLKVTVLNTLKPGQWTLMSAPSTAGCDFSWGDLQIGSLQPWSDSHDYGVEDF